MTSSLHKADFIWSAPIPKLHPIATPSTPSTGAGTADAIVASIRFQFENGAEGYFGSQLWRAGAVDERGEPVLANETQRFVVSVQQQPPPPTTTSAASSKERGMGAGAAGSGGRVVVVRSRGGGTCTHNAGPNGSSVCTAALPFVAGNAYSVGIGLVSSNATGALWSASVTDVKGGGAAVLLGELFLPNHYGKLAPLATSGLEYRHADNCDGQAVVSVGIVGPWFEGTQFTPSQAFAHYSEPCAYSDAYDCIYGAGCGLQRALLTTGGKTKRSHANESAPLW